MAGARDRYDSGVRRAAPESSVVEGDSWRPSISARSRRIIQDGTALDLIAAAIEQQPLEEGSLARAIVTEFCNANDRGDIADEHPIFSIHARPRVLALFNVKLSPKRRRRLIDQQLRG